MAAMMRRSAPWPQLWLTGLLLTSCGEPEAEVTGLNGTGTASAHAVPAISFLGSALTASGETRDLIVLSIDTLRADRLPFYGGDRPLTGSAEEPFSLSWLAAQGTTFDAVWAPGGITLPSLGSLWTGLSPLEHGAMGNREPVLVDGIGHRLLQNGWQGYAMTANGILMKDTGFEKEFTKYLGRSSQNEAGIPKILIPLAEEAIQAKQRVFMWAHYMAPHQPYAPSAASRGKYSAADGIEASTENLHDLFRHPERVTAEVKEHIRALYDEELIDVNQMAMRFLRKLNRTYHDAGRGGLMDNAVIVLVSDHGEGLADRNGFFLHSKSLFSGVVRVPCVVVGGDWPKGVHVEQGIPLAAVLPMVLDGTPPQAPYYFSAIRDMYFSVRDDRWTLIHNPSGDAHGPAGPPAEVPFPYPEVALYDRLQDPLETENVASAHPEVTRQMLNALHQWYLALERPDAEDDTEVSEDNRTALLEMGYAGEVEDNDSVDYTPWPGSAWNP